MPEPTSATSMSTPPLSAPAEVVAQAKIGRPFGLIVVSVLEAMAALSFLAAAAGIEVPGISGKQFAILDTYSIVVPVLGVLSMVAIIAAVGLWFRLYWAWVVTVLFTAVALAINLLAYAWDNPSPGRLLIYVVMAFYLNQGSLRAYLDAGRGSRP
jgi:hypothetical protein